MEGRLSAVGGTVDLAQFCGQAQHMQQLLPMARADVPFVRDRLIVGRVQPNTKSTKPGETIEDTSPAFQLRRENL